MSSEIPDSVMTGEMNLKLPSFAKNRCLSKSALIISVSSIFVAAQPSQAAITITISGEASSTTTIVEIDGTFELSDAVNNVLNAFVVYAPSPAAGDRWRQVGSNIGSATTMNPFLVTQVDVTQDIGPQPDTAVMTISDTSNGGSTIVTSGISNLRYVSATSFGDFELVFTNPPIVLPSTVDAGDIMTLSGSFDLALGAGDTFADRFILGNYDYGSYNGQSITVIVAPEPSSFMLLSLGCLGALCRRRR